MLPQSVEHADSPSQGCEFKPHIALKVEREGKGRNGRGEEGNGGEKRGDEKRILENVSN